MITDNSARLKKRILLAEDEPVVAELLDEVLREAGHEVIGPATDQVELAALVSLMILSFTLPR